MSSTSAQEGQQTQLSTTPIGVIAIDGPAGAGKSSVARELAGRLGVPYLDTGAMYRAAGLLASRAGLEPPLNDQDGAAIAELIALYKIEIEPTGEGTRVRVGDEDVSSEIRTPLCSRMASAVSALTEVRRALLPVQRSLGEGGGVMEGRDIGSVVFPDAQLKIFLTASPAERARRRFKELRERGLEATLEDVREEQRHRDLQDTSRRDAPLHVAQGSVVIDTTGMILEAVVARIVDELEQTRCLMLDSTVRTP